MMKKTVHTRNTTSHNIFISQTILPITHTQLYSIPLTPTWQIDKSDIVNHFLWLVTNPRLEIEDRDIWIYLKRNANECS